LAQAIPTGSQFQIFTDSYKEVETIKEINLPKDICTNIHQNRLLKIAREVTDDTTTSKGF